ncbi:MAG: sporulation protein YunB [Clostridia bacterium]|nr:sporulation protein YunB [Clostridia bacterium]
MRLSIVSGYEKRSITHFLWYILFVLIMLIALFIWINIKVRPFVISITRGYAENVASNTLNAIIDEAMRENEYNFVNVIKNAEDNVVAVTMNSADTNLFMTKISIGLKNRIADMDEIEAKIPLGNFLPYPFLAGLGPEIPVKFLILATSAVSAREDFVSKGINQSLYTLSLHVVTDVGIYIPAMHSSVTVENEIPVAQTVIVGNVPDSYTNVEGMDGSVQDTVLDIE